MAQKKTHEFLQTIHVRRDYEDKDTWLTASEEGIAGVIEDDGPTFVAEYELVKVVVATKSVQFEEVE